jgi:diguanylate cyclase (GGDEF)-like protein
MSLLSRRALAILLVSLLVSGAFSLPAGAQGDQEDDHGDLELLGSDGPLFGPGTDFTFEEARDIMDAAIFEFGWDLPPDIEAEALMNLFLEIALLRELDAFAAGGIPEIEEIHRAYAPWPDLPRREVVDILIDVDDELADLKNEMVPFDVPLAALVPALDELDPDQREQLDQGATAFVPVVAYLQALTLLLSAGSVDDLPRDQVGAVMISELGDALNALAGPGFIGLSIGPGLPFPGPAPEPFPAPTQTQTPTQTPAQTPTRGDEPAMPVDRGDRGDDDTGPPWFLIAAIAGGGALAGMLLGGILMWRRRKADPEKRIEDHVTDQILEAHRLLTGVVDERAIAEIGCGTAVAITGAHDAMIFRRVADGLRRTGETGVFVDSALGRVMETAQPLLTTVDADPAVGGPVAICAVPLVADGAVSAMLVVRSVPEHPFDNEDRRRLELLAPALGGALLSADALDSFEYMAMVDGLTSLGNRRRLDGDLETTLAHAVARDLPVAFAMIDVDHFKDFNDTHGHEAGDVALQTVARIITGAVRHGDVVYRYGGEEFSVLFPGATAAEAAGAAERIRTAVEASVIPGEETQPGGRLTVSVGIATLDGGDAPSLKRRADDALYEAKSRGRNRSVTS